jgi:DNA-binding PadR family transcriptional regulator
VSFEDAALYQSLHRLERQGAVSSLDSTSSPHREGSASGQRVTPSGTMRRQ